MDGFGRQAIPAEQKVPRHGVEPTLEHAEPTLEH
jgi:hypothetical protein